MGCAQERIPLTVCPLSNVRLRVFARMQDHVLRRMLEAGLAVSIHSDDPAYFGGDLNTNLTEAFAALGLDASAAYRVARNSLEAAFVEPTERCRLVDDLDAYASTFDRAS